MSLVAVFRIPAPTGRAFAADAWDPTVGKSMPIRLADPRPIDGWRTGDTVCTAVEVAADGSHADLTLSVFIDDPALVLGMFVPAELISIREGDS